MRFYLRSTYTLATHTYALATPSYALHTLLQRLYLRSSHAPATLYVCFSYAYTYALDTLLPTLYSYAYTYALPKHDAYTYTLPTARLTYTLATLQLRLSYDLALF